MYPYINFLSLSGQLSKVTLDCLSFALLRYVIGPENLRHPLMQPIKFKTMTNRDLATRVFPRFKYVVFSLRSHWLFVIIYFALLADIIT